MHHQSATAIASVLLIAAACGTPPAPPPQKSLIVAVPKAVPIIIKPAPAPPPVPAWTHWKSIELPPLQAPPAPNDATPTRSVGDEERWNALSLAQQERLRRERILWSESDTGATGVRIRQRLQNKSAVVLTFDTLFHLTHAAMDVALGDIEERVWQPALIRMLARLEDRLALEAKSARADLVLAYRTARGLVAVAQKLLHPNATAPPDLTEKVRAEVTKVQKEQGVASSDVLSVPINYGVFGAIADTNSVPESARFQLATAWLSSASLVLVGRGEEGGMGDVSVATARVHMRTALLLARLLDASFEPEAAAAWERIERTTNFIWGPPDDLSPRDLALLAQRIGALLSDTRWIADVARVDRLRNLARENAAPDIFDGNGSLTLDARAGQIQVVPTVRVFPLRDTMDGFVMQQLVFPFVGSEGAAKRRTSPMVDDVLAWLGSSAARDALREVNQDAIEGYTKAFDRLVQAKPSEHGYEWHASVYASSLDVIRTYVLPSVADARTTSTSREALHRHRRNVARAAWARLRQFSTRFGHRAGATLATAATPEADEDHVVFVEEHPEAIAKLLGTFRQFVRGLGGGSEWPVDAPSRAICTDVDLLLSTALNAAIKQVGDESLPSEEQRKLVEWARRVEALESATNPTPIRVAVHQDLGSGEWTLVETSNPRDSLFIMTAHKTHAPVFATGFVTPSREYQKRIGAPVDTHEVHAPEP